jgi:hypothetical protein
MSRTNRSANLSTEMSIYQVMLPARLTDGMIVRRVRVEDRLVIATNLPPLRHNSDSGFDFGNSGPGAADLALSCVQALMVRSDYVGPTQKMWDGSRLYGLAVELHESFLAQFVVSAQGDELTISWNQALGWLRRMLLTRLRERGLTSDTLLLAWRESVDSLPEPPPRTELDRAEAARALRDDLAALTGDASVLSQFLGMVG